jgi:DNA mismatch endonuclease, patch repair protein
MVRPDKAQLSSPSASTRQRMQRQRRRDTGPELAVRRELFSRGLRYRVHTRPLPTLRRTSDIVFSRAMVAVEVHGCFWHLCPEHSRLTDKNRSWWAEKLQRNRERDAETAAALDAAGWSLVVVWEHEDPVQAADRIAQEVAQRRPRRAHRPRQR